jgi:hypothetical protein
MVAYKKHQDAAHEAMQQFKVLCDYPVARVPGMDTVIRLAWRIECGRSIQDAALLEYLYRMNLAIDRWRTFGSPSLLGQ